MDNKIKPKPAIIVDYDTFIENEVVQRFVVSKDKHAELILFVTNPHDFYDENSSNNVSDRELVDAFDWAMVIKNTGDLTDEEFKRNALAAVQNMSTLTPTVFIDEDLRTGLWAESNGVLISFTPTSLDSYLHYMLKAD
jgi:hypothetical protein